jgi:hypothetical protein
MVPAQRRNVRSYLSHFALPNAGSVCCHLARFRSCIKPGLTPWRAPAASRAMLGGQQGERLMPVGMFRSEEGWVQVDYGTSNIPIGLNPQ